MFPGPKLEDYLADAYRFEPGTAEFAALVTRFEPIRRRVEDWLGRFDEEERSWRDYCEAMDWEVELGRSSSWCDAADDAGLPGPEGTAAYVAGLESAPPISHHQPPTMTRAQVSMELWAEGKTTVDQSRVLNGLLPLGRERGGDARRPRTPELRVVRSPRLLDAPTPPPTADEVERQRQKDVGALLKILEHHGVHHRSLYRCRNRTMKGPCDAYRVSGEPCVECGDGLPPRTA